MPRGTESPSYGKFRTTVDPGVPTCIGIHVIFGKLIKVNSGPPLSVDISRKHVASRPWCKKPVRCGSSCLPRSHQTFCPTAAAKLLRVGSETHVAHNFSHYISQPEMLMMDDVISGWPLITLSLGICRCNSAKSGGPTSISQHNPQS